MSERKIPVIVINREYAAGGRSLAAILSEKLGIPYYDKDFVKKTMDEGGFDETDVEREGEEISKSSQIINKLFNGTVSYSSSFDAIFQTEKKVTLDLAKTPCVIVGRCADHVLDEAGIDHISIYLHAPLDKRLKRAAELAENGDLPLEKFVERHDILRRTYYKHYTGCEISDASHYTFCFDVSKVSIPLCAEIILRTLEQTD